MYTPSLEIVSYFYHIINLFKVLALETADANDNCISLCMMGVLAGERSGT